MAQLFDKIVPGHGEAMYTPEGIYHTSPNRLSYHIDANADFANRFSNQLKNVPYVGEGLSLGFDVLAPAASVIPSIGYDASQAYERMEPGSGLSGWWNAFKAENPEISIPGRMAGVLSPLASRFGYEVTGSGFKSLADKKFRQDQFMNTQKQTMQEIIRQAEIEQKRKEAAAATGHQAARERGGDYHSGHESTVGGQTTDWGPMSHMIAGGGLAQHAPIRPYSLGGRVSYFDGGIAGLL